MDKAERKQSMGYDWHPDCLKCEECGKILKPGQHAEVDYSNFILNTVFFPNHHINKCHNNFLISAQRCILLSCSMVRKQIISSFQNFY